MKKHILVRQIMTNKVTVANPDHTLAQVMDFFTLFKVQHLPVVDNSRLVGILSVNDVCRFIHEQLEKGQVISKQTTQQDFKVSNLMTLHPVTVSPETTLEEALELLSAGSFSALPVTENEEICGIVTNKDIVRVIAYEKNKGSIMHIHPEVNVVD